MTRTMPRLRMARLATGGGTLAWAAVLLTPAAHIPEGVREVHEELGLPVAYGDLHPIGLHQTAVTLAPTTSNASSNTGTCSHWTSRWKRSRSPTPTPRPPATRPAPTPALSTARRP